MNQMPEKDRDRLDRPILVSGALPLLQPLLYDHTLLLIAVNITLGALGSWLLWLHRHRAMAVMGVVSVFIAYGAVFLHHLRFAGMLGDPHLACRLALLLAAGDLRSLDNPTRS